MQGKQTPPEIVEQVRTIAAKEGNILEAARQVGIPSTTAFDIVKSDDNFERFRNEVQKEYIVKTWKNILAIEEVLVKKIKTLDPEGNFGVSLRDLTGALKDLKFTVENVMNEITLKDGDKSISISWKNENSN